MSPPLVVENDPLQLLHPKSYLFRNAAHPIYSWQPSPYTYQVWIFGMSSGQVLPYDPATPWYGIRVNMELFAPDDPGWAALGSPVNNVQTFLIVQGAQGTASCSVNPLLLDSATRDLRHRATREAMDELARRQRR